MKEVSAKDIESIVCELCIKANSILEEDVYQTLNKAHQMEESPQGKEILSQLIENAKLARESEVPICQDTGCAVVFIDIGQDVHITEGSLRDAVTEGVRRGYTEGYLRKSMVEDPLRRKNTGDNTPPILHINIVEGENLKITVAPKGGGSENMSKLRMLSPAEGREGVKRFIIDTVRTAGGNPCPPIIVGVGIGGNFEYSAYLAKKALLRPLGERNSNPYYRELEEELLEEINKLGIGPMGIGGRITALDVHIEAYPCHITAIPVAVNIQCHAGRHLSKIL